MTGNALQWNYNGIRAQATSEAGMECNSWSVKLN